MRKYWTVADGDFCSESDNIIDMGGELFYCSWLFDDYVNSGPEDIPASVLYTGSDVFMTKDVDGALHIPAGALGASVPELIWIPVSQ